MHATLVRFSIKSESCLNQIYYSKIQRKNNNQLNAFPFKYNDTFKTGSKCFKNNNKQ